MELKRYQQATLDVLRRFLEDSRIAGPKAAYERITSEPDQAKRLGVYAGAYRALNGLEGVPYVCLRLPTGGGKTILAAHSVQVARDAWIEKDFPLVLWLTPTTTIRQQTVEALKNPRHPYRRALDDAFEGRVRVFDITDFTHIRPHDLTSHLCLVVGTLQTLRVQNTDGRKVYAHHEDLEPHFSGVSPQAEGLERLENGTVRYSFANLLHLHRPLMIVDEAHNAVTGLTREMQERVNPCAIIEFTATPRTNSNTLHNVTAQELKQEEMIKLPIMLSEHDSWQNAVNAAVSSRAELAEEAKGETEYIRPIVLFQAQPKDQEVTVEVLKRHLTEVEQVPENRIAVATGAQRELDGIDLFDRKCPVEYVITMQALKEGWDCSFAYVFCSVANVSSATDVEQLLGRVLRMPYATRRTMEALNRAYAHVPETNFSRAAAALRDKLINMGFDRDEAEDNIQPTQLDLEDGEGLFGRRERPRPVFSHPVTATPGVLTAVAAHAGEAISIQEMEGGRVELRATGALSAEAEQAIYAALEESERQGFTAAVARYRDERLQTLSPAEQGKPFMVPRLMAYVQGELQFADTDTFMEFHEVPLLDYPARLEEGEFNIRETARGFEIDLDGNGLFIQFADEREQLPLDIPVEGWTEENLVLWLDRQLRQKDISQVVLLRWLRDLASYLVHARKLHVNALMRLKFILARKIKDKIDAARMEARSRAYQSYLFAPDAQVEVSFDNGFSFREGMYGDQRRYRGSYRFRKHFLGADHVPAFDGATDGEEFQCAQALDSLGEVEYWIRNVAQHRASFWLPTSSDKFYPDFVALLKDGRSFVVEYKGALLTESADTDEKRTIGRLWEQRMQGKGLFLIVEKTLDGLDMRGQLERKLLISQK